MAADAAVGFLLDKVTGLIISYADLISGAAKEFEQLQLDVELLKANLRTASSNEIQQQVRDVIYDVEDLIDFSLTQAAESKGKGKVTCFAKWFSPNNYSLANDVKNLRTGRVKDMLEMTKSTTGVAVAVAGTSKVQQATATTNTDHKLPRQQKVVPFTDAEDTIIRYLATEQEELDIIPIIGMPGLGKTTMAWKILNDEWTCKEFPLRIWVHFSKTFDSREVFVEIMNQISKGDNDVSSNSDILKLSVQVRASLEGQKFLLVFDDVWDTEHWDVIKDALPSANGTSKVLITSRHMKVGNCVRKYTDPYKQQPFNADESWELLRLEVFGDLKSCPKELEGIGRHIAKECKGVPLTISLMGAVLKERYSSLIDSPEQVEKVWGEMVGNMDQALKDKEKIILNIVEMSYNSLPEHMRDCFLYLGVFPEGYEIPSWTLISLWIAEGFIRPQGGKNLEEVAKDNLDELISRNLLMARKTNPTREVKVCGVHDMIRMFCRIKASELNLFEVINIMENQVANDDLVPELSRIRRLCLHSNLSTFFSSNLSGPRVRSFLSFRKKVVGLEPEYNEFISKCLSRLRVLQSKYIKFDKFPDSITKLAHLRYLVLCVDDLKVLPETISKLWNLQTIIVDTKSDSVRMEANIWKMIHLRHVKTKATIVLDDKLEGLAGKNIQILNRLSTESVTTAFSAKAINLNTLGIHGKLDPLFVDNTSLEKLKELKELKLYHAITENRLQSFPARNCFPPNLKRLSLSNTSLAWKHMSTLALIADLEVLKLKNNAFKGITWNTDNYVFKSLQFLLIVTTDLVIWKASINTFPCLRHLVLKECKDLIQIPDNILQRLKNLEIENVCKSAADSARNSKFKLKLSVGPGCGLPGKD